MRHPKMIGAHAPRKPQVAVRRDSLVESAAMFNRAYDERFAKKRPQLAYQRDLFGPVKQEPNR